MCTVHCSDAARCLLGVSLLSNAQQCVCISCICTCDDGTRCDAVETDLITTTALCLFTPRMPILTTGHATALLQDENQALDDCLRRK